MNAYDVIPVNCQYFVNTFVLK